MERVRVPFELTARLSTTSGNCHPNASPGFPNRPPKVLPRCAPRSSYRYTQAVSKVSSSKFAASYNPTPDRQRLQLRSSESDVSVVQTSTEEVVETSADLGASAEEEPAKQNGSGVTAHSNISEHSRTVGSEQVSTELSSEPPAPTPEPEDDPKDEPEPVSTREGGLNFDSINPLKLGRNSRQLFDDVWQRVTQLGGVVQSPADFDFDEVVGGEACDYDNPLAQYTTVLVVGATGRIGRVLVRKLLLRGYTVRVLVRNDNEETKARLPASKALTVVQASFSNPKEIRKALEGCNKIVFAAGAPLGNDLQIEALDRNGVTVITKEFHDMLHAKAQARKGTSPKAKKMLVNFKADMLEAWKATSYNPVEDISNYDLEDKVELVEGRGEGSNKYGLFRGILSHNSSSATMTGPMKAEIGKRFEALQIRACGDGQPYVCELVSVDAATGAERIYSARFQAPAGFGTVKVPFASFSSPKAEGEQKAAPLDPTTVREMAFRFEPKKTKGSAAQQGHKFRFELVFVKAMPKAEEPDFILVSCAGVRPGEDPDQVARMVALKRAGETRLRNSGLGYTIVRPGPLREEAGGQKALVFDQGGRISQGISCADVADVCLKALHEDLARNKSFEVCYEYSSEQGSLYELVAHLPDKSNDYLKTAMKTLRADT